MAVCGCCWICGAKFECAELQSCGDCTEHKPLTVIRCDEPVRKICGLCEQTIDAGGVGALLQALRVTVDASAERLLEIWKRR